MGDHAAKYEGGQEREGHNEGVEEAVVSLANTVSDPGAVMVKPLCERNIKPHTCNSQTLWCMDLKICPSRNDTRLWLIVVLVLQ